MAQACALSTQQALRCIKRVDTPGSFFAVMGAIVDSANSIRREVCVFLIHAASFIVQVITPCYSVFFEVSNDPSTSTIYSSAASVFIGISEWSVVQVWFILI